MGKGKIGLNKLLAVVGGGHHSVHPVFRRGAAPQKIRIGRTEGNNSGVWIVGGR